MLWLCLCPLAFAQLSPGPLSKAHHQLEGVTACASCHEFGAGIRGFKCMECHVEIKRRVDAHTGLHGRVYNASAGQKDCSRCHVEHAGQTVPLTRFDTARFDHLAQTGFALEGRHRQAPCAACHNAKKIAPAAKQEIKVKDWNKTYLGLGRDCLACHEDKHGGQLGPKCTTCHSQDAWKPAAGFNHSKTAFVLTGLHQTTACQKCHVPAPGEKALRYKGLQFAACQNCHKDPHRGAFVDAKVRGGCESCHDTGGWKKSHISSAFNHTNTKFELRGKHAEVACARCHKDPDFKRPVAHEKCQNCHEDPHKGQFAKRAAGSDCDSCHTEKSFKPSLFDREAHQRTSFRLEEKHAPLDCAKCHLPAGKATVFITGKTKCAECHADAHGREFAAAPLRNRCDSCHTQAGFEHSTFTVARHASDTKFALTGKHARVECSGCHKPLLAAAAPAAATPGFVIAKNTARAQRNYHFASQTCNACHADPHRTKLACETCHTAEQWNSVKPFDHTRTEFALQGAHGALQCGSCHGPKNPPVATAKASKLDFFATPMQCFSCHKDVHGGQFREGERQEDCSSCHTLSRWNAEDFEHDRTRFPLDRAHRDVRCQRCHIERRELEGKVVQVYRGVPTECVKCH